MSDAMPDADPKEMKGGWRQVWDDIRNAMRLPGSGRTEAGERELVEGLSHDEALEGPHEERVPRPGGQEGELDRIEQQDLAFPIPSASSEQRSRRTVPAILALGVIAVGAFVLFGDRLLGTSPKPPAPNVVATYIGGQITVEDLQRHLVVLAPDEELRRQLESPQGYQLLVQEMITDELVRLWAEERKATADEDFQHVMKHITEEINLDELHMQLHQEDMGVNEQDIQAYYESNRDRFGEQSLTQVRDQIKADLQAEKEDQFLRGYIEGLKENAAISRNFELLEVPEPEERELSAFYETNRERYTVPSVAVLDELRIPVGEDEAAVRQQAEEALASLRAGEEFNTVSNQFGEGASLTLGSRVPKGQRKPGYDDVVFGLDEGQISQVFRAGESFYIVRLVSIESERQPSMEEVRDQVTETVMKEKETAWFSEMAERTLFTIHGKRYTVGEFWREYQELPASFLADYQGAEGRKALAERLIERLLLVEDSYDRVLAANEGELDEMRLDVLAQMMEQVEVDDRIEVTDEEVRAYYDEHKAELVMPPQSRIRYIMIGLGETEDERQRAREKADEAYKRLVPGLFQQGEDFAVVAREYSEDELTASQGGELPGWIGEGQDLFAELADHPFHQQVLALREGEISRPFEWGGAVYIVQVLERTDPEPMPFEEARDFLSEDLRLQKHDELLVELSQRLMEQADVEIYESTLQGLFEDQRAD
jgi:parvulin-like peptidyl-prolyl isomerase